MLRRIRNRRTIIIKEGREFHRAAVKLCCTSNVLATALFCSKYRTEQMKTLTQTQCDRYRLLSSSERSSLVLDCNSVHSARSWSRARCSASSCELISACLGDDGISDISRVLASISRSTDSSRHDARNMSYQTITCNVKTRPWHRTKIF